MKKTHGKPIASKILQVIYCLNVGPENDPRSNFEISFIQEIGHNFTCCPDTETHGEAPGCRSSKVDCVGIPGERLGLGPPAVFHGLKKTMGFAISPSIIATINGIYWG